MKHIKAGDRLAEVSVRFSQLVVYQHHVERLTKTQIVTVSADVVKPDGSIPQEAPRTKWRRSDGQMVGSDCWNQRSVSKWDEEQHGAILEAQRRRRRFSRLLDRLKILADGPNQQQVLLLLAQAVELNKAGNEE